MRPTAHRNAAMGIVIAAVILLLVIGLLDVVTAELVNVLPQ